MIRLVVHEDAYALGVRNPVACLVRKFTIVKDAEAALNHDIEELQGLLRDPAHLSRPEATGFSALFEKMGHEDVMPAGQRLVESFRERGFKPINNLVDACNIAAATYASGIGLHDAEDILQDIHVRRALGGETITPLFRDRAKKVAQGDLIYEAGGRLLAWLGRRDVDADGFKITENSRYALIVALGNANTTSEYNRHICQLALRMLKKSCSGVYGQMIPTILPAEI